MKKKIISSILLIVLLIIQLCGCGGEADGAQENHLPEDESVGSSESGEAAVGTEGDLDAAAVSKLTGKDNSLDAYSLVLNVPVRTEDVELAVVEQEQLFLGASNACYFKRHLLEKEEESWDEFTLVNAQGESENIIIDRENSLFCMGGVPGTNHSVALTTVLREGAMRFVVRETDEDQKVLREIPLDFFEGVIETFRGLPSLALDPSGYVHMLRSMEGQWHYYLISPEGELLADYCPQEGEISELVTLYDGRVAFCVKEQPADKGKETQSTLWYMDTEKGEAVSLAALDKNPFRLTLSDENTLIYADSQGVYRTGLSGGEPELLYLWSNHGIRVTDVCAIQADEEGRIAILYEGFGDWNYLRLEPTTEEVEVQHITLAVSPASKTVYQSVVTAFNRRYPACQIELRADYEESALMTELIAGKGPVLIDTILTGFEEQKKLWQPLNEVMEQLGILEELHAPAVNMGRIDGTLYGVVPDFELSTVVTGRQDLKDWDYETFLRCVEESSGLEAMFNGYGGDYGTYFITSFISHGLEDNYLMDAETATTYFDTDEFRRVLKLAKRYCIMEEAVSPGISMLEGKVFCNEVRVMKPEQLAMYRGIYGQDANYIGYPAKDGAAHFLVGREPLAVRVTATKEEKEAACAFLSMFLSHDVLLEAAKDDNYHLSVRKDVLEEQINRVNENTNVYVSGFDQFQVGDLLNKELDAQKLYELLEAARPEKYFPKELRNILSEELGQYFAGEITEEMVISHLENRVGLYLEERK